MMTLSSSIVCFSGLTSIVVTPRGWRKRTCLQHQGSVFPNWLTGTILIESGLTERKAPCATDLT
jgi:hypothetical protein